jgi:hypothetical protein
MSGFLLFLCACFLPAALYVTQPGAFIGLVLVGLFAALVVLLPVAPKAEPAEGSRTRKRRKER